MLTNLILALEISALGMGLVFFAIILLWLMMWALTAIRFKDAGEAATVEVNQTDSDQPTSRGLKAAAAAAAVAVALAEQSESIARPMAPSPTALISAWQLGMRTRQMYEKGEKR